MQDINYGMEQKFWLKYINIVRKQSQTVDFHAILAE
jgi:hypothetical protein